MVESTGMTSVVLSGQAQSTVSTDRDSESSGKTLRPLHDKQKITSLSMTGQSETSWTASESVSKQAGSSGVDSITLGGTVPLSWGILSCLPLPWEEQANSVWPK